MSNETNNTCIKALLARHGTDADKVVREVIRAGRANHFGGLSDCALRCVLIACEEFLDYGGVQYRQHPFSSRLEGAIKMATSRLEQPHLGATGIQSHAISSETVKAAMEAFAEMMLAAAHKVYPACFQGEVEATRRVVAKTRQAGSGRHRSGRRGAPMGSFAFAGVRR